MCRCHKRKIWKRWTSFEESLCYNTSQELVERKARARAKDGGKGYNKGKKENDGRQGKERFRQTRRIHGRILARTERLGIPRIVLDVRQGRTQVMRKSMERLLRRRGRGRQPKMRETTRIRRRWRSRRSVDRRKCGGDQGGKGSREHHTHTHREVEESIQELGKRRWT